MEVKLDVKKRNILIIVVVLMLCIGTTLAYIIAQIQDEARSNASIISDTVDALNFEVDKDISLNPNQFNVVEGGDNLSDTAVGSAILRANSTDNSATYNYYVYFQINTNDYIYTTVEQTPEIVLTITDPNDNPVTNIDGLNYVTSGGVSGFDITTKSGLFNVASLYEITSNSSTQDTIQEWTFTVSFINLETNQANNGGKTLEAEIILSAEEVNQTLADYIISQYTEDGVNGIYLHDGVGTYTNADQEAGDNSYRYSGANPNNYVCFGSNTEVCPEDNLYRIIGVFDDEVKLIKNASIGNYYWSGSSSNTSNTWSSSILNTSTLNGSYLAGLDNNSWSSMITNHTWKVGGNTYKIMYYPDGIPANAYQNEIVNPAENTTYSAKIGLMYISDYYYGASPTYWTYPGSTDWSFPDANGNYGSSYDYRAAASNNWMHIGSYEWTITPRSDDSVSAFHVLPSGEVTNYLVYNNNGNIGVHSLFAVRPVFYLNSNTLYSSGDGSIDNPYRIEI